MNYIKYCFSIFCSSALLVSCSSNKQESKHENQDLNAVPSWAQEAIWYQIFVERFHNGDAANDPTAADIVNAYPNEVPFNWKTTDWGHDWFAPDTYWPNVSAPNYWDKLQLRRYGGDLQGVLDKLDYLQDLGITAIYFNPLNDAPSMHKYDPRYWHHIDRNFGPNPSDDQQLAENENPADAANWPWTSADSLFLQVIKACHQKGIKVIMDYSWNHVGTDFWALKDIAKKGEKSGFKDWFDIEHFDDPATPENEMSFKTWSGAVNLIEVKKAIVGQDTLFPFEGNLANEQLKQHIFAVTKRWLDPNKDGNPEDGVDGYRLDVAAEIPKGFWPEYRQVVRQINPEALLLGEIWWQEWPDKLMDPLPFLGDKGFDAIMNYRWYKLGRSFFGERPTAISPSEFVAQTNALMAGMDTAQAKAMMNLNASHDSPRFSTSFANSNKYKHWSNPQEDSLYIISKPDSLTLAHQYLMLVHQFTWLGAPHIWYGDEVGMWGGDDPNCRKPMLWKDFTYETETTHPYNRPRTHDVVAPNFTLSAFYKQLIQLRKSHPALVHGDLKFTLVDDSKQVLAYTRSLENSTILVVINRSSTDQEIDVKNEIDRNLLTNEVPSDKHKITLKSLTAYVFEVK